MEIDSKIDFQELVQRTKRLTGFQPEHEALLVRAAGLVTPRLPRVTEAFYEILGTIPKAQPFLEGRVDVLKQTHLRWLQSLFTGPYDEAFARQMYMVGMAHVRVKLPVEFMQGAATLIMGELTKALAESGIVVAPAAHALQASPSPSCRSPIKPPHWPKSWKSFSPSPA